MDLVCIALITEFRPTFILIAALHSFKVVICFEHVPTLLRTLGRIDRVSSFWIWETAAIHKNDNTNATILLRVNNEIFLVFGGTDNKMEQPIKRILWCLD